MSFFKLKNICLLLFRMFIKEINTMARIAAKE